MGPIFIIEHLEPELYRWCLIEYKHISKIVGKKNLWFTNIKNKSDKYKLSRYGKVINRSIKEIRVNNKCILDPEVSLLLTPKIASSCNYFVFGGILGDYPAKKRTSAELTRFIKDARKFNIGKKQMSTDNAVYVVKQISIGKSLRQIKFKDNVEIKINKIESTILPYRYVMIKNKPLISRELLLHLKQNK